MRLTPSTLPQLAVLAKILCLLMVVMCGAVPAMVRSVSLYSTCSGGNITVINRTVKAMARNDHNAPFQKLTTQSDDFSKKLYIYAEASERYICFSRHWKPVAVKKNQRTAMCQFYESYNGAYLRYRSAVDSNHTLGFNRRGNPIRNQHGRPECFNFMKYNPTFSIDDHNDWMMGNNGKGTTADDAADDGGEPTRRDLVLMRKLPGNHHQHRSKNSLQAYEVARETMITTTSHRYRHSNRLKQPHEDVSSPRRRHHQSRRLEASKY